MTNMTFSAAGAANLFAVNRKLDMTKLDPRLLVGVESPASPAPSETKAAKLTQGEALRAQLLEAIGLTEDHLIRLPEKARVELEERLARDVRDELAARAGPRTGGYLDVTV